MADVNIRLTVFDQILFAGALIVLGVGCNWVSLNSAAVIRAREVRLSYEVFFDQEDERAVMQHKVLCARVCEKVNQKIEARKSAGERDNPGVVRCDPGMMGGFVFAVDDESLTAVLETILGDELCREYGAVLGVDESAIAADGVAGRPRADKGHFVVDGAVSGRPYTTRADALLQVGCALGVASIWRGYILVRKSRKTSQDSARCA